MEAPDIGHKSSEGSDRVSCFGTCAPAAAKVGRKIHRGHLVTSRRTADLIIWGDQQRALIQWRVGGGPSNLRIVSGGIRSLPAISSAVGSRPITCRKFRQVRRILFKASMVATDKWTSITIPSTAVGTPWPAVLVAHVEDPPRNPDTTSWEGRGRAVRRERPLHSMHRSDQQCCRRSDRRTAMLTARSGGAVQVRAKRS